MRPRLTAVKLHEQFTTHGALVASVTEFIRIFVLVVLIDNVLFLPYRIVRPSRQQMSIDPYIASR